MAVVVFDRADPKEQKVLYNKQESGWETTEIFDGGSIDVHYSGDEVINEVTGYRRGTNFDDFRLTDIGRGEIRQVSMGAVAGEIHFLSTEEEAQFRFAGESEAN